MSTPEDSGQTPLHPAHILDSWGKRGEVAAARLIKHGIPASSTMTTQAGEDGMPTRSISFEMGALGWILVAEMLADHMDEVVTAIDITAEANRIHPEESN